MKGKMKTLN